MFVTVSPPFEDLYSRWFQPSLRRVEPGLEVVTKREAGGGSGDFRSPEYDRHIATKWSLVAGLLMESSDNDVWIICDCDVVFFKPFVAVIDAALNDDRDIVVSWDDYGGQSYNIGIMGVRRNDRVIDLFTQMNERMSHGEWDQGAFNQVVRDGAHLKHAPLSRAFANHDVFSRSAAEERSLLVAYHATGTQPRFGMSSIDLKRQRLSAVAASMRDHQHPAAAHRL